MELNLTNCSAPSADLLCGYHAVDAHWCLPRQFNASLADDRMIMGSTVMVAYLLPLVISLLGVASAVKYSTGVPVDSEEKARLVDREGPSDKGTGRCCACSWTCFGACIGRTLAAICEDVVKYTLSAAVLVACAVSALVPLVVSPGEYLLNRAGTNEVWVAGNVGVATDCVAVLFALLAGVLTCGCWTEAWWWNAFMVLGFSVFGACMDYGATFGRVNAGTVRGDGITAMVLISLYGFVELVNILISRGKREVVGVGCTHVYCGLRGFMWNCCCGDFPVKPRRVYFIVPVTILHGFLMGRVYSVRPCF
jgi:hypothetical protein